MKSLSELVKLRAEQDASKPFCYFEDQKITFGDLRTKVETVAHALSASGISEGDKVGVMLPNTPEHIYTFLAVAWIGAVYLPMSIHLKADGLNFHIGDAEPRVVVADPKYGSELLVAIKDLAAPERVLWTGDSPVVDKRHVSLSKLLAETAKQESAPVDLDRTMVMSYTSGTTGAPKGAILSDRWFQTGANNAAIIADLQPNDVMFLWEPFYNLAAWMSVGASLQRAVPIALVERFSASKCWDQIRQFGATKFHYLGGVINILLRQPPRPDDLDNPVTIAWGGGCPAQSWQEFEKRFGVRIREGYGLTEASNFTMHNLTGKVGSIGKPVAEFEAWLINDEGKVLGPNEIGEIVLKPRFPNLTMKGYFRQPEKTAEVLRDGCVYPGDLAYQDEEGYFYFCGRKKDGIRRKGQNVSAWTIERAVNSLESVEECAVIGVPSDIGDEDIKVFVKVAPNHHIEPLDIIRWCEPRLAYYQMPRYVEIVEDFPRGPTQRIRKTILPRTVDKSWDLEKSGYKLQRQASGA